MKSREQPRSNLSSMAQTTIVCHLANVSVLCGETVRWSKDKMDIRGQSGQRHVLLHARVPQALETACLPLRCCAPIRTIMSKTEKENLPVIAIDGAFGEGGGQIIRTSVSLAAITGRAVEIVNIRARRSKPGLQAQHLTSVRAAGALCDATLHGAELGSQFLRFVPGAKAQADSFRFDVAEARGGASAGATGLVAQTLLVPLAFLPAFTGGAPQPFAPPF